MKKFLVLFVLLFSAWSLPVNADESLNATSVSITLEETKELIPDVLTMGVSVNVNTSKEIDAINILGSIDKTLRDLNLEYHGDKYSVEKNCWWKENQYKCLGYKASIGYVFELKQPADQNRILEELANFKAKYGEKMNFTVSHPEWIISKKNLYKAEEDLKIELIDNVKSFAQKVSEKLGKTCSITSIDYDVRRPAWG